jgi:DNA polymerase-3 subunit gamma/tau
MVSAAITDQVRAQDVDGEGKYQPPLRNWENILPHLKLSGISQGLAEHCCLDQMTATSIILLLDPAYASWLKEIHVKRIEAALIAYLSKPLKLSITVASQMLTNTPARQQQLTNQQRLQEQVQLINNDPNVQKILQNFNGTLLNDSITLEEKSHGKS